MNDELPALPEPDYEDSSGTLITDGRAWNDSSMYSYARQAIIDERERTEREWERADSWMKTADAHVKTLAIVKADRDRLAAEVKALKAYWFADADPAEIPAYAAEYAALKEGASAARATPKETADDRSLEDRRGFEYVLR